MAKTEKPDAGTSDWYEAASEDEDRRFLSGSREHPEELASAGRVSSVSTIVGATALTRMLYLAHSQARVRVMVSTAPLLEQ